MRHVFNRIDRHRLGWLARIAISFLVSLGSVSLTVVRSAVADSAQAITIHAVRYDFEPAEITLKKGQAVRLTFVSDDVPHGISIEGLGIDLDLPKHKPQTVTLTPAATGDFDGECSRYCGTGHGDMTFLVHVVP